MAKTSNQSNQQDTQSFKDQRDILKEINSEIGKQNSALQEAAKSYSVLQSVAFKLQNAEEEISTLNEKQLKDLKAKSQIALRELKSSAEQLKNKQNLSSKEKALLKAAKEKFSIEEEFVKKVEEELESYEKINKQLGVVGGVLKGISKIPILSDVFDANEALDAARKKVKETGSGVKGFGDFFDYAAALSPLGNASAEDCAEYTISLFSDYTRMVTMQNLFHDGGFSNTGFSYDVFKMMEKKSAE
jgi:hypothetical protein